MRLLPPVGVGGLLSALAAFVQVNPHIAIDGQRHAGAASRCICAGCRRFGPVPIIADALGYHPSTIERHAIGSASTYAGYIAAARELRQTS